MKKIGNTSGNRKIGQSAFTLVELIVVITILAILGTIGFISLQSYNTYARDSLRLSNIRTAISGLEIQYTQGGSYALPDNAVEVGSGTSIVLKQGTIGKKVERTIKASSGIGLDPVTQQEYTYATNNYLTRFQILAFFEGDSAMSSSPLGKGMIGEFSQAEDITKIRTFGKEVGALTTESGTPIEKVMSGALDLSSDTTNYIAHFDDTNSKTLTGTTLYNGLYFVNKTAPKKCPTGYIKVPGNIEFMTNDFCVAQFEMSYDETGVSDVTGGIDWNTRKYNSSKTPVSMLGRLPITEIKQEEAIESCKSIGGHLITNNEWMTIARNIEQQSVNWSSGIVGSGGLWRGVSNKDETTDDYNEYGCYGKVEDTDNDGDIDSDDAWAGKTGSNCDGGKNKLKLSNGEYIYDLSGNVWEHVNKSNTIDGSDFNLGQTSLSGSSNGTYWDDDGIYDSIDMLKYSSSLGLGKTSGMGSLYYANGVPNNVFLRGARASTGLSAGVFTFNLGGNSTNQNRNVGFRCVK